SVGVGASITFDYSVDAGGAPAGVAGTVDWTDTVSCTTPGPCTNNTPSLSNSDGSTLVFTDSDSIFASDLDVTVTAAGAGEQLSAATPPVVATTAYNLFNDGPVAITGITFTGTISGT